MCLKQRLQIIFWFKLNVCCYERAQFMCTLKKNIDSTFVFLLYKER